VDLISGLTQITDQLTSSKEIIPTGCHEAPALPRAQTPAFLTYIIENDFAMHVLKHA
jgi:hypothetical protein